MTDLPHNIEAEEAAAGCVLIDPACLADLHFLKADDFYIHRLRYVWGAFLALHEKHAAIDPLTVADELEKRDQLAEIGGPAYLTLLVSQVPTSINAESYGRIVEEYAMRRRLIASSTKAVQAAYDDERTPEEINEAASAVTESVYRESDNDNAFNAGLSAVYDRAGENAKRAAEGLPLNVGLTTGFIDLDKILIGIEPEENVVIAAPTGQGKTAFLLNVAAHVALTLKKRVAIFSQEMGVEEVARRMVASYTGIDSQRIKIGALRDHEWAIFTNAIETLENSGLYVSDATSLTPAKLRSKCLKLKQTTGVDLVIVDYLQLMSAGIKTENRQLEVSYISRRNKMLAKELQTPVFSACQLSRAHEQRANKRPILSDLRESGSIEQDANTVVFLYRPDELKPNEVDAIVAKRRDGALGVASLIYKAPITKFVNATARSFNTNEERLGTE
jgi:replicative DNA helicase